MDNILDFENKLKGKNSWKPVLITNGVFSSIFIAFFCYIFFLAPKNVFSSATEMVSAIFTILFLCITIINILLLFISLFFSKIYWRKWLIMAGFGVVLLIFTIIAIFIFDIGRIL